MELQESNNTPAPAETPAAPVTDNPSLLADTTTPPETVIPEPVVEAYTAKDFTVAPEEIDVALFDEYVNEAKTSGMTKKQVEAQLAKGRELRDRTLAQVQAKIDATKQLWHDQTVADKEIGGDKLQENLAVAKLALNDVTPDFKKLLDDTGLGNHPEMIKLMYRLGKTLKTDTIVAGGRAPDRFSSLAERLYNKT